MTTKRTQYLSVVLTLLFGVIALVGTGCQPPGMTPEERKAYEDSVAQARKDSLLKANKAKCEFKLSNGYEYYKQKNWSKAIDNYEEVRDLGCAPAMAENLYLYLGNSYRENGNRDSAIAVYRSGLNYLSGNLYLLQNLAYMYKITNQVDKQIDIQEKLVQQDSTNIEYLSDLGDLYFSTQQYKKQIKILRKILAIDPENASAQSNLIKAMENAGLDPITALKERWENNNTNASYGIEYGEMLVNRGKYDQAVEVLSKVTTLDSKNIRAYNLLAKSYENLQKYSKAIDAYKGILNIDATRKDIVQNIAKLYISLKDYKQAMDWANKCINTGDKNGMGYAARGSVYENLAQECSKGNPDFNDKLVYQMAYEDYKTAVSKGYGQVTSRIQYLENFIPSKGDWFFHSDEGAEITPDKDCYSWLNRSVKRPSE